MALEKIVKRIELEMSGETKQFALSVKQGDKGSRSIEISLVNEGEPYKIPTGTQVYAHIRKPDRKRVYMPATFSGNVVNVELTNNALAAAGTATGEVELKTADNTQSLTSITFEMEVEPRVQSDDAIQSSDEMTALEAQMKEYADAEAARVTAEKSRATAENARAAAEKNRASAESSRASAETARASAENARTTAEKNRASAESSRVSAETARASTEAARANAEKSRASAETSRVTAENTRAAAETARANAEKSRASAETAREQAEESRRENAQEAIDKANEAVKIANQVNEASYVTDKDSGQKYAYAIYTENGVPHMALTPITE